MCNLVEEREDVLAAERAPPRRHLEQDRAQRVEISAGVDRVISDLLGRHVGYSANQRRSTADGGRLREACGSGHDAG